MDKYILYYYFVRVCKNNELFRDVGPFDRVTQGIGDTIGALDWIYHQIGLLKTHYPKQELKKELWKYQKSKDVCSEPEVKIKLNIAEFSFELFKLSKPQFSNVVGELIEEPELPKWARNSKRSDIEMDDIPF